MSPLAEKIITSIIALGACAGLISAATYLLRDSQTLVEKANVRTSEQQQIIDIYRPQDATNSVSVSLTNSNN